MTRKEIKIPCALCGIPLAEPDALLVEIDDGLPETVCESCAVSNEEQQRRFTNHYQIRKDTRHASR